MYIKYFKRTFDFILSALTILVLSPFILIFAALIKIESRGPIFFKQQRVGKNQKFFNVLKLRTMTHEKREVGNAPIIGKADGVTKIGYFLRRYKLDELPQVINVFLGDMSIVGPRPNVPKQLDNLSELEKKRYLVRPGLTGLAQVSGNIHISWKERYVYDLKYIKNMSFSNDLRIIVKTFLIIIKGEDKFIHKSENLIKTNE